MPSKRIAITGIGPISSIGIGKEKLWKNLLKGQINVEKESFFADKEVWDSFYIHKVKNFNIKDFEIDPNVLDYIREWKNGEEIPDLYYLLAAVSLALRDSQLTSNSADLALVLAHENLNLMPMALKMSERAFDILTDENTSKISRKVFYERLLNDCLKTGYDAQTFMGLFHVAKAFNIHNYSLFINNACASGLYALEAASDIIQSSKSKIVVVAVSDHPDIYKYIWFRDIGLYSKDGIIRPFCKDSNGLVFGDGGIALVLEELEHARMRKVPVYAEYLGAGFSLEGWKVTTPQIGSNSYQQAIAQAIERSQVNKNEIDLLCPHGVGSQPIDYYEAKAITDTFGINPKKPLITTFKPYVGHNLGGSALLETAIMLLSLKNNVVLPTLNYMHPDAKFNIGLVKEKTKATLSTAMKICCAFAGYNTAAIFRKLD